ncbi:hypothetical protein D0T49_04915 [Paludibacter sp. 221]|nr:hypothetical protein [Paludibacter sp. 221]
MYYLKKIIAHRLISFYNVNHQLIVNSYEIEIIFNESNNQHIFKPCFAGFLSKRRKIRRENKDFYLEVV